VKTKASFCCLPSAKSYQTLFTFVAFNKAGVKMQLFDTVKARKLAYYGHTMRKQGRCVEKEIMQGTMPDARRRGRPRTAWMDNINTWTGLSMEESVRMTEDRDKWRKYVRGVANPRIEDGWRTEFFSKLQQAMRVSFSSNAVYRPCTNTFSRPEHHNVPPSSEKRFFAATAAWQRRSV